MNPIHRSIYRAQIKKGQTEAAIDHFRQCAILFGTGLATGDVMTISLFHWGLNIFAYWEGVGQEIAPDTIFGDMSEYLESWHGGANPQPLQTRSFVPMMDIFHCLAPESVEHWRRKAPIAQIMGRVARLKPEMVSSYIFYHYQLQEEKPGSFDKYGIITLHENLIFFYQELPFVVESLQNSGKLATNNTPHDWHGTMFPHFHLWEDAPAGQGIWREIELIVHL